MDKAHNQHNGPQPKVISHQVYALNLHDGDGSSYDSYCDMIHAVDDAMMLLVFLTLALKWSLNPMDPLNLNCPFHGASEIYFSSR